MIGCQIKSSLLPPVPIKDKYVCQASLAVDSCEATTFLNPHYSGGGTGGGGGGGGYLPRQLYLQYDLGFDINLPAA